MQDTVVNQYKCGMPVTINWSTAKIGLTGPILAAKTGPPCQFQSPIRKRKF